MSDLVRCSNGHMYNTKRYGNKCPFCDAGLEKAGRKVSQPAIDSEKTQTTDDPIGIEPVVGWLVCIDGEQKGKDYKIRKGKNFIGRSDEMDIAILGDISISRKNHAAISYNQKQRNFFLIPGDGAGLVYRNNEVVFMPVELSSYDLIEIGKSKLIFIPLCGVHFDWENTDEEV
ncbi:MAG: FHA domain-containing protein [Bacillota bacterium]|nr:FHA domain-containing protein [Bacillota bacterium]